jgi:hypothetical protein
MTVAAIDRAILEFITETYRRRAAAQVRQAATRERSAGRRDALSGLHHRPELSARAFSVRKAVGDRSVTLTQQPDRTRNNTLFHWWPGPACDEVIAAAAVAVRPRTGEGGSPNDYLLC